MRVRFECAGRAARLSALFFLATALSAAIAAQTPAPLVGTWTFNPAKSTNNTGPLAFRRATCRIETSDAGVRVIYDIVRVRGGVTHTEWTGRLDGRDYAVQGIDAVVTNAYTRIDDRTYDIAQRVDGTLVVTARMTVSADGRTLTTTTPTTTTVYEKEN